MYKLRYICGSLLLILVATVSAQLPAEQNNKAGFRKSAYGGVFFHTQGLGLNLYFSKFKLWDPEQAGNGLGYPPQRVLNLGVQVNF